MPELPEVEIVRQSLHKKISKKKVKKVIIRNRNLRFKIPINFASFFEYFSFFCESSFFLNIPHILIDILKVLN